MPLQEFVDIAYSSESTSTFHRFDLYLPSQTPKTAQPLVVFIHGGAWRSEDKSDQATLARSLAESLQLPIAVPNYRLTPTDPAAAKVQHPAHAEDILLFLEYLGTWGGPTTFAKPPYDSSHLYIIGHSCGAHMILAILLDSSKVTPSLAPSPHTLKSIQATIMSEGIYDLDVLLRSFPSYKEWFVAPAFGEMSSYQEFSTLTLPLRAPHIRWLIVHSKGDSLVDEQQSLLAYDHLRKLSPSLAVKNTQQLIEDHNDVLASNIYVQIVSDFIRADIAKHHI